MCMKKTAIRLLALLLLCFMLLPMLLACNTPQNAITIGENGNFFIDGKDSGISSTPSKEPKINIGENGNFFIDGEDTGISSTPSTGPEVTVGANGNWFLNGKDTGIPSTGSDPVEKEFVPVIRFAVTSDIHVREGSNDLQSMDNLKKLVTTAYSYSASQSYKKLDGMFIVGDYTQNGSEAEMTKFFNYVNQAIKSETTFRVVLGNHEFWSTGRYTEASLAATFEKYLRYGNYDSVDQHLTIGGYHFLILNMDRYNDNYTGSKYSPAKLEWLDQEMAKAAAADPTGTKPIFIFNHMPATGTVNNSSQSSSDDYLEAVLAKYPQAVDFSGHTHHALTDPRSIWQGDYTAINTGSLAYLATVLTNHPNYDKVGIIGLDNEGNWEYGDIETAVRNGCLYYLVEINAEHEIRLVVNNIFTEKVEFIIDLGKVGDPSAYTFNETRKYKADTPAFPDGASLTVANTKRSAITVTIPQALGDVAISNYRIEAYNGIQKVSTGYSLACTYLGDATPATIKGTVEGLAKNTTYTIKVIPVNYWGKEGTPLEITAKTLDGTVSLTPNLFSVSYNSNGSATSTLDNVTLREVGNVTVSNDATLGKNVAVLDGQSAYMYDGMSSLYPSLKDGFSIELQCYINAIPSSGYVNVVSNQEGGGFGFELKDWGDMQFIIHTGNGYERVGVSFSKYTNQWVHLVATYDPSARSLAIYVNGQQANEIKTTGNSLGLPRLQYLCIGGDSGNEQSGGNFMAGKIGIVNIYDDAFTAAEVATIYGKTKS